MCMVSHDFNITFFHYEPESVYAAGGTVQNRGKLRVSVAALSAV